MEHDEGESVEAIKDRERVFWTASATGQYWPVLETDKRWGGGEIIHHRSNGVAMMRRVLKP